MKQLLLIFLNICHSTNEDMKNEVYKNLSQSDKDKNWIGSGCSSNVYSFSFNNIDLAVKVYKDQKRCERETKFLNDLVERNKIKVLPKYYSLDSKKAVTIMERLDKNLSEYLTEIKDDREKQKEVLNKIIQSLQVLHSKGIVHGNLHAKNIMLKGEDVYFIDFDEAFMSEDLSIDFLRLKFHVFSRFENLGELIDEKSEPFKLLFDVYSSRMIAFTFRIANYFNAPAIQRIVIGFFYYFTNLKGFNQSYLNNLKKMI